MNLFVCGVCGHLEFDHAPQECPVCKSPKEKYSQKDTVFEESSANSKEAAVKHIPAITVNKKCGLIPEIPCTDIIVRIGATLHPMEQKHFIQFVDCYLDQKYITRIAFTPAVSPAACIHIKTPGRTVTIVENCNLHGYWKAESLI
jgi:superoxide reductase